MAAAVKRYVLQKLEFNERSHDLGEKRGDIESTLRIVHRSDNQAVTKQQELR